MERFKFVVNLLTLFGVCFLLGIWVYGSIKGIQDALRRPRDGMSKIDLYMFIAMLLIGLIIALNLIFDLFVFLSR